MRDTGQGIAAEEIETLFSRFGKLHRTATVNSEGIGLGLTIVKKIVELTGGKVQAQSAGIGHGSKFTLTIPIIILDSREKSKISQFNGNIPKRAFD